MKRVINNSFHYKIAKEGKTMKNIFKKTLCVILVLIMIYGISPAISAESSDNESEIITSADGKWLYKIFNYSGDLNCIELYRYIGDDIEVVIPEMIDGYYVLRIGDYCFLSEVPSDVSLPQSAVIINGENNDRIKSVKIPSTVCYIGKLAFAYMDSLEKVEFDKSVSIFSNLLEIGIKVFLGSEKLTKLELPEYGNYDSLSSIWPLSGSIKQLSIPSFRDKYSFHGREKMINIARVKNLTITGNFSFNDANKFLTNDLKTVEFTDCVSGGVGYYSNYSLFKYKPDLIIHHILPENTENFILSRNYNKYYDSETGYTYYSSTISPDTTYTPVKDENKSIITFSSGNFDYALTESGNAVIIAYNGEESNIVFPSELDGHTVTALGTGKKAINVNGAVEITIPDTVEYIAKKAFFGNHSIEKVNFPAGLKIIDTSAFKNCSVREVILPNITYLGASAFENCMPEIISIPSTIKEIPPHAFARTVKSNSDYFNPGRLKNLSIAEGVDSIGFSAFDFYCYSNEEYDYATGTGSITLGDTEICGTFECDTHGLELNLPSSIKYMSCYSFRGANLRGRIDLPIGLKKLKEGTFINNRSLSSVKLNQDLECIESDVFRFAHFTEPVVIPESVIKLEGYALCDICAPEIILPKDTVIIPVGCFESCILGKLSIPKSVKVISRFAFQWSLIYELYLPSSVILIGEKAFCGWFILFVFGCERLLNCYDGFIDYESPDKPYIEHIIIAETVRELPSECFKDIPITDEITIMPGIETIGDKAFYDKDISEIIIPGTVVSIGESTFENCENMETAIISDSVTEIGDDAFKNCPNLTIYCTELSYAHTYAKANGINVSTLVIDPIPNQTYTGYAIKPDINVTWSGKTLEKAIDYSTQYSNNVSVGTANVTVTGKGDYDLFSSSANFTIVTRSIYGGSISSISDQNYTGYEITPSIKVRVNGKLLTEGVDYTATYYNNIAIGTATVQVKGIRNYSGVLTGTFEIRTLSLSERIAIRISEIIRSIFSVFFSALSREE